MQSELEDSADRILYVVHCVDAEGPLNETLCATFERLKYIFGIDLLPTSENLLKLQAGELKTGDSSKDAQILRTFSVDVLKYNVNWEDIHEMNIRIFSHPLRSRNLDDFGNLWKITWFCLDHVNYKSNPREKAMGYSVVYRYYRNLLKKYPQYGDEIQWHFHPKAINHNPIAGATSYNNSMQEILEILARKTIDDGWFPTVFRPGFHSERQDANFFLEQWFPFDYGNQNYETEILQPDLSNGRFGDWSRAPNSWRGYHPSIMKYDVVGSLSRTIFRCLNMGTRLRLLEKHHIEEAFQEAQISGDAIVSFTDHDFRDIEPDINKFQEMLFETKKNYPNVQIRFCTAEEAAQRMLGKFGSTVQLLLALKDNRLLITCKLGEIFGSQPFLAIKTKDGQYLHDNLDFTSDGRSWTYTFDEQTLELNEVAIIGVSSAGKFGGSFTERIFL